MLVCKKGFPSCYPSWFWKISNIIHEQGSTETQPSAAQSSHSPACAEPLPLSLIQDNWNLLLKILYKEITCSSSLSPTGCRKQQHWMVKKNTSVSQKERCTSLRGLSRQAGSAHLYSPLASHGKAPVEEARHPQDSGHSHQLCTNAFTLGNRS